MMSSIFRAISLALVAGLLVACAGAPKAVRSTASDGSLAALEERALARWQALIEQRPGDAYEYLTPGFRATHTRDEYSRDVFRGPIRWRSAAWQSADCQEGAQSCLVTMLLTYTVRMSGAGEVSNVHSLDERWLFVDGHWYHLPQ